MVVFMKRYIIDGGNLLNGTIKIDGSKNATLALITSSLLCKSTVTLTNVPNISDVIDMLNILKELNVNYTYVNNTLKIDSSNIINKPLLGNEIRRIRASYYFMGTLISLFKEVQIVAPGGCKIGNRPIDYHLNGFKKLGIKIKENNDIFQLSYDILNNTTITLPSPSVGATINLILASVLSDNVVIIDNISCEPEVIQVIDFLVKSGGKIKNIDERTIVIIGVRKLKPISFEVMNDRIEAGTYCILGALLGNNLTINGVDKNNLLSLLSLFNQINVSYKLLNNNITFYKSKLLNSIEVTTAPYPLFPTDLQQPLCVLASFLKGESIIYEDIYYDRKGHINELNKMGGEILSFNNKIIIKGNKVLMGNNVVASDLRGGAALVIAALCAKGKSVISNIHYIERGYPDIINKLNKVGARIKEIDL